MKIHSIFTLTGQIPITSNYQKQTYRLTIPSQEAYYQSMSKLKVLRTRIFSDVTKQQKHALIQLKEHKASGRLGNKVKPENKTLHEEIKSYRFINKNFSTGEANERIKYGTGGKNNHAGSSGSTVVTESKRSLFS